MNVKLLGMPAALACVVLSVATGSCQFANAESFWDHNGSIVELKDSGNARRFYYRTPRAGLPVSSGMLLFEGRKNQNTYSGTAYVFSTTCGQLKYPVEGVVSEDQRTVRLYGKVPRRDSNCKVTGYRDDELVFTYRPSEADPSEVQVTELQVGDVSAEDAELAAQIVESNFRCAVPNTFGEAASGGQKMQKANKLSTNTRSFQLAITQNETYVGRVTDTRSMDASGRAPPGASVSSSEYKSVMEFSADYSELVGAGHYASPGELVSGGAAHYVKLVCRENRPCIRYCNQLVGGQRHCSTSSDSGGIQVCSQEAANDIRQDMGKLVAFNRRSRSR